jgi:hypothetical protein
MSELMRDAIKSPTERISPANMQTSSGQLPQSERAP